MAAVTYGQREEIIIIDAEVTEEAFWIGRQLNITVQAEVENLKKIPETIKAGDSRLRIFAEGRKPRCLLCSQKDHIRAECKPPQKEKESEEPETGDQKTRRKSRGSREAADGGKEKRRSSSKVCQWGNEEKNRESEN